MTDDPRSKPAPQRRHEVNASSVRQANKPQIPASLIFETIHTGEVRVPLDNGRFVYKRVGDLTEEDVRRYRESLKGQTRPKSSSVRRKSHDDKETAR